MESGNDKKKLIIIGVLGVVIVGVGAFQFLGSSSTPDKPKAPNSAPEATEGSEVPQDVNKNLVAGMLPQRDPFLPGVLPQDPNAPPQPNAQSAASKAPNRNPRSGGGRRPGGFSVPPMDPLVGQLPDPSGIGANNGAGLQVQPGRPLRQPGEFAYNVNGVVLGNRPAAVFQDDNGNQRLVPVGGSVDGDSRVVSIVRGKVIVQHKGKKLTLTMGGGTSVGK